MQPSESSAAIRCPSCGPKPNGGVYCPDCGEVLLHGASSARNHDLTRAAVTEREMELVAQREDLRQALADALAEIDRLRKELAL